MSKRWFGVVLLSLVLSASALGADDPKPLTAAQRERLKERDRFQEEAQQLARAGKVADAVAVLRKKLMIDREVYGSVHHSVATTLVALGGYHNKLADFDAARKALQEALITREKLYSPQDWRVLDVRLALQDVNLHERLEPTQRAKLDEANRLHRRGTTLHKEGKTEEAIPLIRQAMAFRKEFLGDRHPRYANSLNNLAVLYKAMGNYEKALPLYEQAREVLKAALGDRHPDCAEIVNNLASLHKAMGNYEKALPLYEQALALRKAMLGVRHPDYATSLNTLAVLYKDMGDYRKALPLYEQALAVRKVVLGDRHPDYATSLNGLAVLYKVMGDYQQALPLYEQARDLRKAVLGDRHPAYAEILNNLAVLYQEMGDYPKALPLLKQALDLRGAIVGERHPHYASSLSSLALLYKAMGEYEKALPLQEQACGLCKTALGERHPEFARTLGALGVLHVAMGDYEKALPVYEQARDLRKAVLGERHPDYASSLYNLAGLYKARGDYQKALPLYEQARNLDKTVLGERHPDYAASLNNLASLHQAMGNHERALPLYEQARDLRKAVLGDRHPRYAETLSNLATLYQNMGNYEKALPLYEQARDLRKATLGDRHPRYAETLSNLATLYQAMGDNHKALTLIEQARDLRKAALGGHHPHYAETLITLAKLHKSMGNYEKALRLYEQARDLFRAVLGERHPEFTSSLNGLALLYKAMGDYEKALPLSEQALAVRKAVLGDRHPDYAASLNNLAVLYKAMGNYEKALPLYEQALAVRKAVLGDRHPDYVQTLTNLAMLELSQGKAKDAQELFRLAAGVRQRQLSSTFTCLSDRQRLDLLFRSRLSLASYLSAATAHPTPIVPVYEGALAWKGSLATRQAEDRLAADHPGFQPQLDKLRALRAGLAQLSSHPPTPIGQQAWLKRFRDLEQQKEETEQKLARLSQDFHRLHQRRSASTQQVIDALPRDTALVDFLEYAHYAPDPQRKGCWLVEKRLLAFVLRHSNEPVMVQFGTLDPINKAMQAWRKPITAVPPGEPDQQAAQELSRLVWQPLRQHLGDATSVLIAPDGVLCGLPFAALPGSKPGSYLIEEVAIGYVTSGRHLLETADERRPAEGLLAVGGLDFGAAPAARADEDGLRSRFAPWDYLIGTRLELEQVGRSWSAAFPKGRPARLLDGTNADKTRLQRELTASKDHPRWRYLHLATHGYFTPPEPEAKVRVEESDDLFDLEQSQRTFRRDPLLLSGLVLSGANRNPETGLLSAAEVAALDLRGLELAVLSACETGLGRVAGGQGVFGLQRAFQEASAKSLLVSLWSVSDPATSLLMEEFYTQLWGKEPVSKLEALRRAQLKVLRNPGLIEARRRELLAALAQRKPGAELRGPGKVSVLLPDGGKVKEERAHPAYWAAFLLSGDWR